MAGLALQAPTSSELLWGSRAGYRVEGRRERGLNQLTSVLLCSAGVGISGGAERRLRVYEDSSVLGLSNGQFCRKNPSVNGPSFASWWGGRGWNSGAKKMEVVASALDGETSDRSSQFGDLGNDAGLGRVARAGNKYGEFFVDQQYKYDRGEDGDPGSEAEDVTAHAKEQRQPTGREGWVQLDGERGFRVGYGRVENTDDTYGWERASARGRREGNNQGRGTENDQTGLGDGSRVVEQGEEFVRGSLGTRDRSLGPSGRDNDGAVGYERRLGSRFSAGSEEDIDSNYDEGQMNGGKFVPEIEKRRPGSTGGYFADEQEYVGRRKEVSPNLSIENGLVDERLAFQTSRKYQGSEFAVDAELDQSVVEEERTGRSRGVSRGYGDETEQEVLARGALYAKQVISQATAQNLGIVTQLWVDMQSLKVVALEVRPNLLFGDLNGILLKSVSKVGDVVLIDHENDILEELSFFNCSDLVGSDLLTENGFYLGKVRDYNFNLQDGEVVSLEFDTFGVPFIPSTVISTYSLTVDEVIEAQEDSLLVRHGAEKRVRKLTKGLFSRPKQPSIRRRRSRPTVKRKKVPQLTSSSSSFREAPELGYVGSSMDRRREKEGGFEYSEFTPGLSASRNRQLERDSAYSDDRRGVRGDSFAANNLESDQAEDPYFNSEFPSQGRVISPENADDFQTLQPLKRDILKDGSEDTQEDTQEDRGSQRRSSGRRMSAPEVKRNSRGLPMSYRTKRSIEDDV